MCATLKATKNNFGNSDNTLMIYKIVKYGDPVLDAPAATITEFNTPELRRLVADMFESMYAAQGVGLAAPQIGIAKRIAVIDVTFKEDPPQKLLPIHPELLSHHTRPPR